MEFTPSIYQQNIKTWFDSRNGKHLIVQAPAGSGKTRTGVWLIEGMTEIEKRGTIFVAFNKDIAVVLRQKLAPIGAVGSTYHSLGLRSIKKTYPNAKVVDGGYDKSFAILKNMLGANEKWMMPSVSKLIGMCKNLLIMNPTFNDLYDLSLEYDVELFDKEDNTARDRIFEVTPRALAISRERTDLIDYDDMPSMPITDDHINPIQYDTLLVDEVQDTNLAQSFLAINSVTEGGTIMGIGDKRQCVIDKTKVMCYTKDSLEQNTFSGVKEMSVANIKVGDEIVSGYGNGLSGKGKILNIYKKDVVNKPVVRVITATGKELVTTAEHTYFAGWDVGNFDNKHYVYLMEREGNFRIGKAGSYRQLGNKTVLGFRGRGNQEQAEKMWILAMCNSDNEARYFEAYYSYYYGIPQWLFRVDGRGYALAYSNDDIDRLYSSIDTKERAEELLRDLGLDRNYPHYLPKSMGKRHRRNFTITLCGEQRKNWLPMHRFSVSGSDMEDAKIVESLGFPTKPAKNGRGWRCESATQDMSKIEEIYKKISSKLETNLITKAHLVKGKSLDFMPASNLHIGMTVFILDNEEIITDVITSKTDELYTGTVYDFDVERVHNFVAGGIVTHNSIYAFRGATSGAMEQFRQELGADELPLSISYRCPTLVRDYVNKEFPDIAFETPEWAIEGTIDTISKEKIHETIVENDMVLCRINAELVPVAFSLIRKGIKATIKGKDIGKSLVTLIKKQRADDVPDLFYNLEEFREKQYAKFLKLDKVGKIAQLDDQIATLDVMSEGASSVAELITRCETLFSDERSAVTLSTIHKAKGLEAKNVYILRPDLLPHPMAKKPEHIAQESNLKYVAVTRTQEKLTWVV